MAFFYGMTPLATLASRRRGCWKPWFPGSHIRLMYVAKFEEAIYVLHWFENRLSRPASRTGQSPPRAIAPWSVPGRKRKWRSTPKSAMWQNLNCSTICVPNLHRFRTLPVFFS